MRILNNLELIAACSWLFILGLLSIWNLIPQQPAQFQIAVAKSEQKSALAPIELEPVVDEFKRTVDNFIVVGSSLTDADIEGIHAAVESYEIPQERVPIDKMILSIRHKGRIRLRLGRENCAVCSMGKGTLSG